MQHKEMMKFALVAIVVLGFVVPATVLANPKGGEGRRQMRKQHRAMFKAKMKKVRAKVLRERVGLSEKRAVRLEQTLDGFNKQRWLIKKEMHRNHKKLRQLLLDDSNDQRAYKQSIDALAVGRAKIDVLKGEQMSALRKQLNPKEQAKAMMALHRMRRRMHRRMRKMHRGQRRGGKAWRGHGRRDANRGPPPAGAGSEVDGPLMAPPSPHCVQGLEGPPESDEGDR